MRNILVNYIIKNKKNFFIITIIFCIGIAIGIFFINNTKNIQKSEISSYIENLIDYSNNFEKIDKIQLLYVSIKNNLIFIIIIWLLGCTIIGGPFIYVAVLYKGISIGYTISALIAVLGVKIGIIISILSLLLQNILFLPAVFIISENGIKLYNGIYKRCINIKQEFIKHTIIMFISSGIAIISSLIEVYCSTNLLIFFISKL